jgi:hypothetical protein
MSLRERRRVGKLARSGQRIIDPQPAELVREYISWSRRFTRRYFLFVAAVAVYYLIIEIIRALLGSPLRLTWGRLLLPALSILSALLLLLYRQREARTSRLNGWDFPDAGATGRRRKG